MSPWSRPEPLIEPPPEHVRGLTVAAGLLASVAGYINAVTLAGTWHVATTHMSGTTTRFSVDLSDGAGNVTLLLDVGLVLAFVVGAAVTGAVVDSTQLRVGRRYGGLLVLEAAVVAIAWRLGLAGQVVHLGFIAFAAGLQNALATQLSRAIVRTTHVTGILTDIGIALGKWIAHRHVTRWRVALYLTLFGGFAAGAMGGASAWHAFGLDALLVPAAVTGIGGLAYSIHARRAALPRD